jgi:hypothetical protein
MYGVEGYSRISRGSRGGSPMSWLVARLPNTRVQRTRSSPSALRSPLTRHPLGLAIPLIAALGWGVGCSSSGAGGTRPPSIQTQCGATRGSEVSREQASCIARAEGLPAGVKPWRVTLVGSQPDGKFGQWEISSTQTDLDGSPPGCPGGETIVIERLGGKVVDRHEWRAICDP